ncbi:hypothetical protein HK099_006862 [Clydaea vesicula]|uniref:Uncharacterized protein n=1 Tax=Clydaea vesicula TaxID=447962 RepID=A0AAD5U8U6_9FUNG|nr:hypothetical protein HK099_006862 [Clydaea vesicula]
MINSLIAKFEPAKPNKPHQNYKRKITPVYDPSTQSFKILFTDDLKNDVNFKKGYSNSLLKQNSLSNLNSSTKSNYRIPNREIESSETFFSKKNFKCESKSDNTKCIVNNNKVEIKKEPYISSKSFSNIKKVKSVFDVGEVVGSSFLASNLMQIKEKNDCKTKEIEKNFSPEKSSEKIAENGERKIFNHNSVVQDDNEEEEYHFLTVKQLIYIYERLSKQQGFTQVSKGFWMELVKERVKLNGLTSSSKKDSVVLDKVIDEVIEDAKVHIEISPAGFFKEPNLNVNVFEDDTNKNKTGKSAMERNKTKNADTSFNATLTNKNPNLNVLDIPSSAESDSAVYKSTINTTFPVDTSDIQESVAYNSSKGNGGSLIKEVNEALISSAHNPSIMLETPSAINDNDFAFDKFEEIIDQIVKSNSTESLTCSTDIKKSKSTEEFKCLKSNDACIGEEITPIFGGSATFVELNNSKSIEEIQCAAVLPAENLFLPVFNEKLLSTESRLPSKNNEKENTQNETEFNGLMESILKESKITWDFWGKDETDTEVLLPPTEEVTPIGNSIDNLTFDKEELIENLTSKQGQSTLDSCLTTIKDEKLVRSLSIDRVKSSAKCVDPLNNSTKMEANDINLTQLNVVAEVTEKSMVIKEKKFDLQNPSFDEILDPYSNSLSKSSSANGLKLKKKKHNCDMIVCGVKTLTVDGRKVHEIDLKCHSCNSQFVLSAAHECADSDEDEGVMEITSSKGDENDSIYGDLFTSNRGLEWLTDGDKDCINLIL